MKKLLIVAVLLGPQLSPRLSAQDSLSLGALQRSALSRDPRTAQTDLLRRASALRQRSLTTEHRPQPSLNARGTHQSDVTRVALGIPNVTPPTPPYTQMQATVDLEQVVYDGGSVGARRAIERARLTEQEANLGSQLYRLTGEVNAAFFSALALESRLEELSLVAGDVSARLAEVRARVLAGSALPRDSAALVAEAIRVRSLVEESEAARDASLETLSLLTGLRIDRTTKLTAPALDAPARELLPLVNEATAIAERPEVAQYRASRARLDAEAAAASVETRPKVAIFGQTGVGRPGLNQFNTDPDGFYLYGIRATWRPFVWGSDRRNAELLTLQARALDTEERAFAESLRRAVAADVAQLARLERALPLDDALIVARLEIERAARAQFDEGVVTAAQWIDARSDLLEARVQRSRHLTELEQTRAHLLTTLGRPIR